MTSARYFSCDNFFNALFFDGMCLSKRNATNLFLEGHMLYIHIYIYILCILYIDIDIDKQMYISDVYIG